MKVFQVQEEWTEYIENKQRRLELVEGLEQCCLVQDKTLTGAEISQCFTHELYLCPREGYACDITQYMIFVDIQVPSIIVDIPRYISEHQNVTVRVLRFTAVKPWVEFQSKR